MSQQQMIPVLTEKSRCDVDDPWIYKLHTLARDIAERLELDEKQKGEVEFFADRIMDKLESSLMYYQMITTADFDKRNISQKRSIYEGLYANLWSLYKGRVQNYIKEMGWNLEFIFCKEKSFEKLSKKFLEENPDHKDIIKFIKTQRKNWQTIFGFSRDVAEHSGDFRDGTPTFENPDDAKQLFTQVCWTAEMLIAYFGSYKIEQQWGVTEINPKSNIFDRSDRYVVEHAFTAMQRGKDNENKK